MSITRLTALVAAIVLIIFGATPFSTHAQGSAYLRAVHYLTGAPNVDIYIDGVAVLTNLGFQDATAYTPLTPGKHILNFGVAGKSSGSSATDINLEVVEGDLFTYVFSGTMADKAPDIFVTSETGLAKTANITFDNKSMPLLFLQGAKDAGEVDVFVNDAKVGTAKSGTVMVATIPYGPYKLKVTAAGDESKVLKDTAAISMNHIIGVLGLTGPADKLSLDYAYSTPDDAGKFLDAQKSLPFSFNSLLKAVGAAKLDDTLAGPGPMTIFAPVDEAFAKVQPEGTIDKLEADPDAIGGVVKYHIIGEYVSFGDVLSMVTSATAKKTLNGQDMTVTLADSGTVFGGTPATIFAYNIHTSNAVIHLINAVLLPPAK